MKSRKSLGSTNQTQRISPLAGILGYTVRLTLISTVRMMILKVKGKFFLIFSKEDEKSLESEEVKMDTKEQEADMINQLKQESLLEKMNKRPGDSVKRESKSEAAKIARYNIKLLESIYQAYDPEKADNVVKVFRKGGVFSIEPIMEEDFEESVDLESQGTLEANPGIAGAALAGGLIAGAALSGNNGGKGKLGDIKEENSQLLELEDLEDKKPSGEKNKDLNLLNENNSEQTGYDFDKNDKGDPFGSIDDDTDFNALATGAVVGAATVGLVKDGDKDKFKNNRYEESSSEFEDETVFDQNGKKKRRRRRKKKKKDPYNAKIRQLEEIYDNPNSRAGKVRFKKSIL